MTVPLNSELIPIQNTLQKHPGVPILDVSDTDWDDFANTGNMHDYWFHFDLHRSVHEQQELLRKLDIMRQKFGNEYLLLRRDGKCQAGVVIKRRWARGGGDTLVVRAILGDGNAFEGSLKVMGGASAQYVSDMEKDWAEFMFPGFGERGK